VQAKQNLSSGRVITRPSIHLPHSINREFYSTRFDFLDTGVFRGFDSSGRWQQNGRKY
jgi:hypothetical protein